MTEEILYGKDAREVLKKGIDKVADAVKVTLGAKGRNVVIGNIHGSPHVTKDGVTVANSIHLEDLAEAQGANIIRQTASRTAQMAGDGTSTSVVLAQEIITEGFKLLDDKSNPVELKRGIDAAIKIVVEKLQSISIPIGDDMDKITQIATISANNDPEIGQLIGNTFKKAGKAAVLNVTTSPDEKTFVKIVDGMEFNNGLASPYFVTNEGKLVCELDDPIIMICDYKVSRVQDIVPACELAAEQERPLLLICQDLEGEALSALILNKMNGRIKFCAIRVSGNSKRDLLEDIATLTGGIFMSDIKGHTIQQVEKLQLGSAERVVVSQDKTIIVRGKGAKEQIEVRCNSIKELMSLAETDNEKIVLEERYAKLSGGIAIMYVGASTEFELKEKLDRVDDAIRATKAAIEEGILPGGGTALIRAKESLFEVIAGDTDFNRGCKIVYDSLSAPLKQMCENSGLPSKESMVLDEQGSFGFNFKTETIEDLVETGVIDPTKVVRVALENAGSIASTMLTTECLIVQNDK